MRQFRIMFLFLTLNTLCSMAYAQTPLSGLTWGTNTIKWGFAQPGPQPYGLGNVTSAITDPAQQAAVAAGVQEWAAVSGINLVFVTDLSQAQIQIGYGNPPNLIGQDLWFYDPSSNTFIYDFVLLSDPAIAPLSVDSSGQLSYDDGVELQQLACHEFGAGIGLAEGPGTDLGSVMDHVLTSANRVPNAADIAAIQSIYGPPASPTPAPTPVPTPAPTPSPLPGKFCAVEGRLCRFSGSKKIYYGANGTYTSRYLRSRNGGVSCSNAVFGDPLPNVVKSCYIGN